MTQMFSPPNEKLHTCLWIYTSGGGLIMASINVPHLLSNGNVCRTIPPHEMYTCSSSHHQPPVSHLFPAHHLWINFSSEKLSHPEIYASDSSRHHLCPVWFLPREKTPHPENLVMAPINVPQLINVPHLLSNGNVCRTIPPHEIYACGSCHHQPPVSHLFPACDKTYQVKNYPTLKLMIPAPSLMSSMVASAWKTLFPSEHLLLFMCMTPDLLVTAKFCVHVLCSTICTTHNILFLVSRSCEDFQLCTSV